MDPRDLYNLLFDKFTISSNDGRHSELTRFARLLRRSSPLGCLIQSCDETIASPLRSECVTRPSLFISAVLSADWKGGRPVSNLTEVALTTGQLLAIALREPMVWRGETPRCDRLRVVGIGIPATALEALGVGQQFDDLFRRDGAPIVIKAARMTPRLQSLAEDMLAPSICGDATAHLLADAHAMEMLAWTMSAFGHDERIDALTPRDRMLIGRVRDLLETDLSASWTLAGLAKATGVSTRSLNTKFRAAFGVPVFEYLKRRRLEFARDALLHRRVSVAEIAYQVGYASPANFTTAFRRYFGHVPSALRRMPAHLN
jgi:AraC-like DNA-binding protein